MDYELDQDQQAIADAVEALLGQHAGVHRFTVGQRKGLGLSSSVPLYVVAMDASTRTVTPSMACGICAITAQGIDAKARPAMASLRNMFSPSLEGTLTHGLQSNNIDS